MKLIFVLKYLKLLSCGHTYVTNRVAVKFRRLGIPLQKPSAHCGRRVPMTRRLIYRWRNLPEIIELGLRHCAVEREEHRIWFERTLRAVDRELFIIEVAGKAAGTSALRF